MRAPRCVHTRTPPQMGYSGGKAQHNPSSPENPPWGEPCQAPGAGPEASRAPATGGARCTLPNAVGSGSVSPWLGRAQTCWQSRPWVKPFFDTCAKTYR